MARPVRKGDFHLAVPERIPYAREPRKLPTVLSADEVVQFLELVSSLKARVALTTAYAAGLRVSEVAGLKVRDVDSGRMVMRIEHGKGGKERYAMLSAPLLGILRTHRTAIANSRLVAVDDDEVAFSYKDYRRGGRSRVMRLAPHEFIRRFLLHALPDGFHRIRHYGFLAKGERGQNLERARALLYARSANEPADDPTAPAGRTRARHLRSLRPLPGLRRPHAPHRPHRRIANRPIPMRHVMTTTGGPISTRLVS